MNSNDENPTGETLECHVDRISALPDTVLSRILSLLPTKDSVRTSALSTRWAHLYSSVHVIDFQYRAPDSALATVISNAIKAVSKKLPRVSKFRVHLHGSPFDCSDVVSWFEIAISHCVRELDLYAVSVSEAPTPRSVFACEALVSLSLDLNFVLSLPDSVCLPNLKELYLRNIVLRDETDNETVNRLFTSCPMLESLTLVSWRMDKDRLFKFNACVPSLKFLIVSLPEVWEYELLIDCPNLETLDCKGYATRGDPGDVLGSLKESYFDVELHKDQLKEGKLMALVKQVCNVQFLSLAGDSMALLSHPCSLPTFENLTHLELHSLYSVGWQLLPSLLESSPRLESLVFPRGFYDRDDNGVSFSPPEHVPVCLSFHLKVIRINRFYGEEEEYKIVEYFLTNALVLEKMEICPWSCGGSEEEYDPNFEGEVEKEGEGEGENERKMEVEGEGECEGEGEGEEQGEFESDFERHFEITRRLLTFQRFSDVCQILIVEED